MILISDIYASRVILRCAHEKCIARMPLFSIFLGEDDVGYGLIGRVPGRGKMAHVGHIESVVAAHIFQCCPALRN